MFLDASSQEWHERHIFRRSCLAENSFKQEKEDIVVFTPGPGDETLKGFRVTVQPLHTVSWQAFQQYQMPSLPQGTDNFCTCQGQWYNVNDRRKVFMTNYYERDMPGSPDSKSYASTTELTGRPSPFKYFTGKYDTWIQYTLTPSLQYSVTEEPLTLCTDGKKYHRQSYKIIDIILRLCLRSCY